MENKDITIVYPPAIDYKFMYQRPHQMMKAFAQIGCNVVFINPANIYRQDVAIETPFKHLPNFRVVRRGVDPAAFGLLKGKVVLWCAVNQADYIRRHKHDLAVFDSCDLASDEFSVWKPVVPVMESLTQITFATAQAIYDEHKSRGVNVYLLPNGADYEHFKGATNRLLPLPPEIPPKWAGGKIVGYYGALAGWLDVGLVYEIAKKYRVVMVGSNQLFNRKISHPNVIVVPMKPYVELPRYLSWFDVAIIPFKLTNLIHATDPVKFYEYISAGKPVAASEMNELKRHGEHVYFMDRYNCREVIERAIAENNEEKITARKRHAFRNSWISRAEEAIEIIKFHLK